MTCADPDEWPCQWCGEFGSPCFCDAADICDECGEYWQYCGCEPRLDEEMGE